VRRAEPTAWSQPGPKVMRRGMGRTVAVVWHASFSIAAGVLYFFFVLPRWPELLGDTSHTLGTVLRIVTGALIGLPRCLWCSAAAYPTTGVRDAAAGLDAAHIIDRAACARGRADHRHRDQRDLVECRPRRSVAVRHLRCRRGGRPARHVRVLPGLRGGAAARLRPNRSRPRRPSRAAAVAARPPKTPAKKCRRPRTRCPRRTKPKNAPSPSRTRSLPMSLLKPRRRSRRPRSRSRRPRTRRLTQPNPRRPTAGWATAGRPARPPNGAAGACARRRCRGLASSRLAEA